MIEIPSFYRENDFRLHEIEQGRKFPGAKAWQRTQKRADDVQPHLKNGRHDKFAVVLDGKHLVIDVDVEYTDSNGKVQHAGATGLESLARLEQVVGCKLGDVCGAVVRSPGGGLHYYFSKPVDTEIPGALSDYPGLDFLRVGKQVVGAGSCGLNVDGHYRFIGSDSPTLRAIPDKLLSHLVEKSQATAAPKEQADHSNNDGKPGAEFNSSQRGLDLFVAEMRVAGYVIRAAREKDSIYEWDRPNKGTDSKFSGLIGQRESGVYYSVAFSASESLFPQNERISIFYAYALLCHGGQENKAADALYSRGFAKSENIEVSLSQFMKAEKNEKVASPPPKSRDRYKPFPSHLLPSPMRELVEEAAQAIGCDESYIALPLLSATGAAIGNTARLVVKKGWNVPPAIWTLIIGESGTAKSPAFKVAKAPIQRYQKQKLDEYRQERGVYDEAMEQYNLRVKEARKSKTGEFPDKPECPTLDRVIVSDCTVESLAPIFNQNPRGLLLQRDELNGWLGSFNAYKSTKGADESAWLSMFDGESLTVDRKGEGTEPTFVESALVSITGGIQPKVFADSMSQEHRASGMAARFLVAQPPRVPQSWTDDEISESTQVLIDRLFIKLLGVDFADAQSAQPHFVGLSADAKSVFREFFNNHHREQADLVGDDAAAWSKLLGYVPRVALIFHAVKQVHIDGDITSAVAADTMIAAIELIGWFKNEAARLYAAIDDSDGQREVREVAEWITRRGGEATPSDLVRGFKSIANVEQAEAMGRELVRAGLAIWATIDTSSGTGPQKRVLRTT